MSLEELTQIVKDYKDPVIHRAFVDRVAYNFGLTPGDIETTITLFRKDMLSINMIVILENVNKEAVEFELGIACDMLRAERNK